MVFEIIIFYYLSYKESPYRFYPQEDCLSIHRFDAVSHSTKKYAVLKEASAKANDKLDLSISVINFGHSEDSYKLEKLRNAPKEISQSLFGGAKSQMAKESAADRRMQLCVDFKDVW